MHSRMPSSNVSDAVQRRAQARGRENGVSGSASSVRPLQISRPPSRPQTPASSRGDSTLSTSPRQPTRPQRSVNRDRQASAYTTSDRASMDSSRTRESADPYADAFDPSPSHPRPQSRSRNNSSAYLHPMPTNGASRSGTSFTSPVSPMSDGSEPLSATSMAAVAMFQGLARRRATLDDDAAEEEYRNKRRQEMEDQQERQRKLKSKTPGYRVNGKAKAGDIDAILDETKDDWAALINPDFNPVDLALQLLDETSSFGKDMESFRRTKVSLSQALKGSVDKHYEAFAAALPHHAALLNHLGVTQTQIVEAKSALQEAKETLGKKRPDLVQLWSRSQTIEDMMRILDQIERLRQVPDMLESLILEKRLLQAAILLIRSLKLINKQDMLEIGAVSDLRSYLISQETSLREILIDELHSHLYLKSFWCESRWAVYTPGQQSFIKVEYEDEAAVENKLSQVPSSSSGANAPRPLRLRRFLDDLAVRPNDPPFDINEQELRNSTSGMTLTTSASTSVLGIPNGTATGSSAVPSLAPITMNQLQQMSNPEADSFMYIETLLEALAVLGKLGNSLDIVAQKLPTEIYALVDSTIAEVEERAEYGRRGSVFATTSGSPKVDNPLRLAAAGALSLSSGVTGVSTVTGSYSGAAGLRLTSLESSTKWADQETLRDLFWSLYSKLDAVAQGLRVVYEVAKRIGSRRNYKDAIGEKPGNLFPIADVWMPVQAEVRTLISDYVTGEEQGTISGRNPISSINEILRDGKSSRDRSKHVFRFADTDPKDTSNVLREHEDELTRVLRDSVPGLVQGISENAVQATLSAVGTDDRLLGTGQHHRLLVRPDAFHVTVLFQPTLSYLERLSDVLPSGLEAARSSHELLDEFVLKVYLPQLEDKVSLLFHQIVSSPDAFEPDYASTKLSSQPLIKASVQLLALINSLCIMLQTTPFHRENYARLILTVIGQFYQRCSDRFGDLVAVREDASEDSLRIALAAQWAQRAELSACLTELYKLIITANSSVKSKQMCRQETHLELNVLGTESIASSDLVSSVRNVSALASLYRSITWFTEKLSSMTSVAEGPLSPHSPTKVDPMTPIATLQPAMTCLGKGDRLSLPLSTAMALRFQALSMTYAQLAELILFSIRIDIRCRIMHQMESALRRGVYHIDREVTEPDPYVIDLNVELSKCDEVVSTTLPEKERRFVFEGVGQLLEHLLIANARFIRSANALGVTKMMRNILALQQNIKTLAEDSYEAEFEQAKRYYSLFMLSPQDMLDGIRRKQEFTFDEYKTMLDLMCGVDPTQNNAAPQASDRNHSMYVIDLHGLVLEEAGS